MAKIKKSKKVIKAERIAANKPAVPLSPTPTVYVPEEAKVEEKVNGSSLIKIASQPVELITLKDAKNHLVKGFMGVYNISEKEVVSVVSDTYKLLPNKQIIDPVLNFLEKENVKYYFDRFSWVSERRMRLHFTFPDFKIKDDTKEGIISSVFLHNSYDMIESFRMEVGAMRQVCSNGMVIGKLLKRIKVVHRAENIQEISVAHINSIINGFWDNNVAIEAYIKQMVAEKVTMKFLAKLSTKVEGKIFSHLMKSVGLVDADTKNRDVVRNIKDFDPNQIIGQNQWQVYNILTQYVSHITLQRYRLDYLRRISRFFGL